MADEERQRLVRAVENARSGLGSLCHALSHAINGIKRYWDSVSQLDLHDTRQPRGGEEG